MLPHRRQWWRRMRKVKGRAHAGEAQVSVEKSGCGRGLLEKFDSALNAEEERTHLPVVAGWRAGHFTGWRAVPLITDQA